MPNNTPPHNLEAEKQVLGILLGNNKNLAKISSILAPEDFYEPLHEHIYKAITDLVQADKAADPITVFQYLRDKGISKREDHAAYLIELYTDVIISADLETHATIVAEQATRRNILAAASQTAQIVMQFSGEIPELSEKVQEIIFASIKNKNTTKLEFIKEQFPDYLNNLESRAENKNAKGILSGIQELDEITGGFQPGQMIIIAARPGVGKTTLALNILRNATIRQSKPACFFSLEMAREEIFDKIISAECNIPLHALKTGTLTNQQWEIIAQNTDNIMQAPLVVDDSTETSALSMATKSREMAIKEGLALIAIDYLQLMSSGQKVESRQLEVAEFSRKIKLLAKELQVPIIALSQLNRAAESRASKRPAISDLRESGALEQDADMVLLLHREDLYDTQNVRRGEADLIIAKHRNGPTTSIPLAFQGHYSKFTEMNKIGLS